ncbi:hypothetical protein [Priestia megaterium]|uniref:hypothetical protein n=1 Tax=Priestia megaterium TaxID=1404 RepID=UPI001128E3D0|nr:hypothetical protein [Priestia megaterium]TPF18095.1 hypothetical protein CBE78_02375 [Priestia megaterium]TPF22202.1 hypothetical protein CBE79_04880 [Priestia megaterium]
MKISWKAVGDFFFELLKAIFTMYIVYVVVDPSNRSEYTLSALIGIMWYVLFIKGDFGEKK